MINIAISAILAVACAAMINRDCFIETELYGVGMQKDKLLKWLSDVDILETWDILPSMRNTTINEYLYSESSTKDVLIGISITRSDKEGENGF